MIVINFKNYVYGKKGANLARRIEKYLPRAIVCIGACDIGLIRKNTKLQIFGQHVDSRQGKRNTGFILPEVIKERGASGTLLNHSEHKLDFGEIENAIKICDKNGLKVILCASNVKEAERLKVLRPWAMAFEDPELIASGRSVTLYRGNEVRAFVDIIKKTKIIPLCGAGIHTPQDVVSSKHLGCKGVLISSAIANVSLERAEELLRGISNKYS